MKKLKDFKESKLYQNILEKISDEYEPKYEEWVDSIPDNLKTSRCKFMIRVLDNHPFENGLDVYYEYWKTNSKIERIRILNGDESAEEYRKKLKNRPRPKNFSVLDSGYWIKRKGLNEADANKMVSEYQSKNAKKRKKSSYKNHDSKLKHSIKYWTKIGYSVEESEILREPYLRKMRNDYDSLVERYGESEGRKKYEERISKFKKTSEKNRRNRKSAGYVSKESLRFFLPLYKKLRKMGIERKDIYLGVNGSREFFIRHKGIKNVGRFYDFAIPKMNIVIEYNGTFWHPRDKDDWKNPWIDYNDAMCIENEKRMLCEQRGYDLIVVWSDSDLDREMENIINLVNDRMN